MQKPNIIYPRAVGAAANTGDKSEWEKRIDISRLIKQAKRQDRACPCANPENDYKRFAAFCPWLSGMEEELAGVLKDQLFSLLMTAMNQGDDETAHGILQVTQLTQQDVSRRIVSNISACEFVKLVGNTGYYKIRIEGRPMECYTYEDGQRFIRRDNTNKRRRFISEQAAAAIAAEKDRALALLEAAKSGADGFLKAEFGAGDVYFKACSVSRYRFIAERCVGSVGVFSYLCTAADFVEAFDFRQFADVRDTATENNVRKSEIAALAFPLLLTAKSSGDLFLYDELRYLADEASPEDAAYLNSCDGGQRFVPSRIYSAEAIHVLSCACYPPSFFSRRYKYFFQLLIDGVVQAAEPLLCNGQTMLLCSTSNHMVECYITDGAAERLKERVLSDFGKVMVPNCSFRSDTV